MGRNQSERAKDPAAEAARLRILERLLDAGVDLNSRSTPETPGVDMVRLRLLRMETRRWQNEAKVRGVVVVMPQNPGLVDAELPSPNPSSPPWISFDDWAFGGAEGLLRVRQQLDKLLDRKLREVEQIFQLTPAQRRKLRLAGKGDLLRVLDLIEDAHREFERARTDAGRLVELQKTLRLVELKVVEGPFEIGSLFSKTLRKMVDERDHPLVRRLTGVITALAYWERLRISS